MAGVWAKMPIKVFLLQIHSFDVYGNYRARAFGPYPCGLTSTVKHPVMGVR